MASDDYEPSIDSSDGYEPSIDSSDAYEPAAVAAKSSKPKKSTRKGSRSGKTAGGGKKRSSPAGGRGGSKASSAAAPSTSKRSKKVKDASGGTKEVEEMWEKVNPVEHILLRPDTYVGSVEPTTEKLWVWDPEDNRMQFRKVTYPPALYKIFDEILVNAADNAQKDPDGMTYISVSIAPSAGTITVKNDGEGIPCAIHKKEGVYVTEMIFGQLLTSSNYRDEQARVTGGRNGYGAKLTNIFSTKFSVETYDSKAGKLYRQTWTDNMSKRGEPKIKAHTATGGDFVKVCFQPDLAKFGIANFTPDVVALFEKRVYDIAACNPSLKVYLGRTRLRVSSFQDYVNLYPIPVSHSTGKPYRRFFASPNKRWEIGVTVAADGQFRQVSFVNSIATTEGGSHVAHVLKKFTKVLKDTLNKGNKGARIAPAQIKNHLWIFVRCLINNPAFNSQTKTTLTSKVSTFGSRCDLSDDFIAKVGRSGLKPLLLEWAQFRSKQVLKKTSGSKSKRISGIPKLSDANEAGTRKASKCTLVLTEGDSAMTLAISGLSVVGRDYYGVFPLKGKLLNAREASHAQLQRNAELNNIKKILGLKHGQKYENLNSLRYGKLMIMADQDHDGSHIKGLLLNFIHYFWPELLGLGFVVEFITPIVKARKGKQELSFFTLPEYQEWKSRQGSLKGWNVRYYKGLGTSTPAEAKEYFQALAKHKVRFDYRPERDSEVMELAFAKDRANDRKDWIAGHCEGTFLDTTSGRVTIKDFIHKEFRLFSVEDCRRSIPALMDGLKPGQRKILFSCFKRKLRREIKVAQLAGYVSEQSSYHHGEASLQAAIVHMAHTYPGSLNVNLLHPVGQFGSRLAGGKDAASARYINTRLSTITRMLFHPDDDPLLSYLNDDGQSIEPEYYAPIVPLVLVNGAEGIGSGWSTNLANYNPTDVIASLRAMLRGEDPAHLLPWWRGFEGSVVEEKPNVYRITGCWEWVDDTTLRITELPIRTWTQPYKEFLESMLVGCDSKAKVKCIKDYREFHTDTTVDFEVVIEASMLDRVHKDGVEKVFKLSTPLSCTNMVLFDCRGQIRRYDTVGDVLREFYEERLRLYGARKAWLAEELQRKWEVCDNKVRFIQAVISGQMVVQNKKRAVLLEELRAAGFTPFPPQSSGKAGRNSSNNDHVPDDDDDGDESDTEHGNEVAAQKASDYNYLLRMPLWNLTREMVARLKGQRNDARAELETLLATSPKQLWTADLDALEVGLKEWNAQHEKELLKGMKKAKVNKRPAPDRSSVVRQAFYALSPAVKDGVPASSGADTSGVAGRLTFGDDLRKTALSNSARSSASKAKAASSKTKKATTKEKATKEKKPKKARPTSTAPAAASIYDAYLSSDDSDSMDDLCALDSSSDDAGASSDSGSPTKLTSTKSFSYNKIRTAAAASPKPVVNLALSSSGDGPGSEDESMDTSEEEEEEVPPVTRQAKGSRQAKQSSITAYTSSKKKKGSTAPKAAAKRAPASKKRAPPVPSSSEEDDSVSLEEVPPPRSRSTRSRARKKVNYAAMCSEEDESEAWGTPSDDDESY